MNRSQFLAALAIVVVLGGLIASRIQAGNETDESAEAADGSGEAQDAGSTGVASASASTGDEPPASTAAPVVVADPPPILDPKPELTNLDGWINSDAESLADFDGQVRVVEFWTFGCFNCKNRISHTQELYAEYQPKGLEIIGVHAPEFERERDPAAVEQATIDLGVTWPVALDTEKTNFRTWQSKRRFWPRVYVLDQNGDVRYDHIGEGDYDGLEETVAYLIENGP